MTTENTTMYEYEHMWKGQYKRSLAGSGMGYQVSPRAPVVDSKAATSRKRSSATANNIDQSFPLVCDLSSSGSKTLLAWIYKVTSSSYRTHFSLLPSPQYCHCLICLLRWTMYWNMPRLLPFPSNFEAAGPQSVYYPIIELIFPPDCFCFPQSSYSFLPDSPLEEKR